ncbi:hypothetical protein ACWEU6_13885 [Streptosporangium sandarakinum]|uniref:hypothetical protein n=1 Tax=Streptosporangium sandarakinum TaxID=1260955 RepID=UPI00369E6B26
MYDITMGSPAAEAQLDALSDPEIDTLPEIYEVLRLTPGNGRRLTTTGGMYVWDHCRPEAGSRETRRAVRIRRHAAWPADRIGCR